MDQIEIFRDRKKSLPKENLAYRVKLPPQQRKKQKLESKS